MSIVHSSYIYVVIENYYYFYMCETTVPIFQGGTQVL